VGGGAIPAAAPARLVQKLDADPARAERWSWAEEGAAWTVTTDGGERVTVSPAAGVVRAPGDVRCSCLLSPRCLHVLAVVVRLAPAAGEVAAAAPTASGDVEAVAVDAPMSAAAARAWSAGAALLASGANGAGTLRQAELLRGIHGCRAAGLHRAAAAGTRVIGWMRELAADRPEFELSGLSADLAELLACARSVAGAPVADRGWIGEARRAYLPAGNLRLFGVFTDAVVSRAGHAGVVTYLTDGTGRLFTRGDVAPGGAARALAAYEAPAGLGDALLPHRELGRSGLFVSDATASRDGRLGAGAGVKAVRAAAPSSWDDAEVARLWRAPLAEQLARRVAAEERPQDARPAGWDLAFVSGEIVAVGADAVWMATPDAPGSGLRLVTPAHDARLRTRENLIALRAARGLRVRVVGRFRAAEARTLEPLALGPAPGEQRLAIAVALAGRANLAFDALGVARADAEPEREPAPPAAALPRDPLEPLRRRVERAALGGLATLPPEAGGEIAREAAGLEARMLGGAAAALRDLAAAAATAERTVAGLRRAADATLFAQSWLRAARYLEAARRALAHARWLGSPP
jgi:hypothetical protein